MPERLVIVGGDAAGMSAATQARRLRDDLEIVAFERGSHTSYSACGIPYYIGDVVHEPQRLIVRTPEKFRERHRVDVRIRTEVEEIDLDRRRVRARPLDGEPVWEPFDHLLVATGATPVRPPLPGADARGVHGVQVLGDGIAIRRGLEDDPPRNVVIVGGGYIGLEMAEAMKNRGLEVAVVEATSQPMSTLDPDMAALVTEAMREMGIEVFLEEPVKGFEEERGRVRAVVTEQRTLPADLVVLGLGVRPNVELAERAGIPVGEAGGLETDPRMRTPVEGVWAAGDCVQTVHRITGKPVTIALGTHANKQGRVAGTNIGGGDATFGGVIGTAVTKVCDIEVARTGLREADAAAEGFDAFALHTRSITRAGYFPGRARIDVKVIADRRSGRLLGAQLVGREGAAKRIDVFATALWNEMTVQEIAGMDLGYAPPFAPVWDPVLLASRRTAERLGFLAV